MYHLNFSFHSISCFFGVCVFLHFHPLLPSLYTCVSYPPLLISSSASWIWSELTCGLILTCALLRRAEERPEPFSIQRAAAAADASSEGASGGGEREAASSAAKGTCQKEAEFAGHAKRCTKEFEKKVTNYMKDPPVPEKNVVMGSLSVFK